MAEGRNDLEGYDSEVEKEEDEVRKDSLGRSGTGVPESGAQVNDSEVLYDERGMSLEGSGGKTIPCELDDDNGRENWFLTQLAKPMVKYYKCNYCASFADKSYEKVADHQITCKYRVVSNNKENKQN